MRTMKLESIRDLLHHMPKADDPERRAIFRGQGTDLPLIPSLFRPGHACASRKSWQEYEALIIRLFKRQAGSCLDALPTSHSDWMLLAQHYRVPTRLLDWSYNPLVALFFAVEDLSAESPAVVYSFYGDRLRLLPFKTTNDLKEIKSVQVLIPHGISDRIVAQQACVTIHPLPIVRNAFAPFETSVSADKKGRLCKFIFPGEKKFDLRRELDDMGVNDHSVYPDLAGLGSKIKWKIERLRRTTPTPKTRVTQNLSAPS